MRLRLAVAGVSLLLLAAGLAVTLGRGQSRGAGDNGKPIVIGVVVPGGRTFCQAKTPVPADAAFLRVTVSTAGEPGGPLDVTVFKHGRRIAGGSAPGGYVDQPVDVPVKGIDRELATATVCVRNGGPKQAAFMGNYAGPSEAPARAGKVAQPQAVPATGNSAAIILGEKPKRGERQIVARFDWRRAKRESDFGYADVFAERMQFARPSWVGDWTPWALLVALLLAIALAVRTVVRGDDR